MEVYLHIFSTSALDGDERSVSRPGRFATGEKASGTHWLGGWLGPRAGPDVVAKRRTPCRETNPGRRNHVPKYY